ncbi:MAG TPA: ROK family transcriptional regulator [Firmicutes bacterium]|nr:ROK family transcriptional regulator [Bacillota bacterium]
MRLVKQANTSLIINVLKAQGPLSQAEISRITKLTKSTVSGIINELMSAGVIREAGVGTAGSSGGRRPTLLELNPEAFYVVGVDIGTTNIHAILTNLTGASLNEKAIPTLPRDGLDSLVRRTVELIKEIVQEPGIQMSELVGIGVAAAGLVDHKTGVVKYSPNFNWRNVPLKDLLENTIQVPVSVDNCTRVMARGEMWFGAAKTVSNLLYVNVGYGIGSALVIDKKVVQRDSEMGHIAVMEDGPVCGCGKAGCVEAISSGSAIEAKAREAVNQGRSSMMRDLCDGDPSRITAKIVADAARAGDITARRVMSDAGRYLGKAIAAAVNFFNPELVVIGGGVSLAGDIYLEPVLSGFRSYVMRDLYSDDKIVLSELGIRGGVLGGAGLILGEFSRLDAGGPPGRIEDVRSANSY